MTNAYSPAIYVAPSSRRCSGIMHRFCTTRMPARASISAAASFLMPSGNHLATERLGAPAPDAVNPRKLGPVARARQGDHRDQAVRQKQAGLDADAWRRLAAPLPEPLDAALDGGRDPGARAVLDPRQLVLAERQPASDGFEDGVAPARDHSGSGAGNLDELVPVSRCGLGEPHERLLGENLEHRETPG